MYLISWLNQRWSVHLQRLACKIAVPLQSAAIAPDTTKYCERAWPPVFDLLGSTSGEESGFLFFFRNWSFPPDPLHPGSLIWWMDKVEIPGTVIDSRLYWKAHLSGAANHASVRASRIPRKMPATSIGFRTGEPSFLRFSSMVGFRGRSVGFDARHTNACTRFSSSFSSTAGAYGIPRLSEPEPCPQPFFSLSSHAIPPLNHARSRIWRHWNMLPYSKPRSLPDFV